MTADGVAHDVDVIIYGTGFQASKFLTPMKVTGRDGVDLHEHWKGDAPCVPRRHHSRIPEPVLPVRAEHEHRDQRQHHLLLRVRGALHPRVHASSCSTADHRALDVRKDVHDAFNERVDAENALMAWGWSDVSSWYKNEHGHVAQNWPFTLLEYWQRTLAPDPDDYELID